MSFPSGSEGKESVYLQCRRPGFNPWVGKIPGEEEMAVFLPGEFHEQRNLAGYKVHGVTKGWTQLSD